MLLELTSLAGAAALVARTASGSTDVRSSVAARSIIEQLASEQITDRFT